MVRLPKVVHSSEVHCPGKIQGPSAHVDDDKWGGGVVPSGPGPPGSCSAEAPGPIRGPTGQSWLAEHTWTLSVQ